ncbi:MAG: hypothetical protein ACR2KU_06335 [Gammaproteobacteria bacterium]
MNNDNNNPSEILARLPRSNAINAVMPELALAHYSYVAATTAMGFKRHWSPALKLFHHLHTGLPRELKH